MFAFDLKLISKYRGALMGMAMLSILLGHYHGLSGGSHWKMTDILCSVFPGLFMSETFLFLSGFGLYYAYNKRTSLKDFYRRRVNRLLLPFFLISLPFFLYTWYVGNITSLQLVGYLSTVSFWIEGNYYSMWYIALSAFLYAIFPIIYNIIFSGKNIGWRFVFFLFIIYSLIFLLKYYSPNYYNITAIGVSQIPAFIIGVVFGYLSCSNNNKWSIYKIFLFLLLPLISVKLLSFYFSDIVFCVKLMQRIVGIVFFCILLELRWIKTGWGGAIYALDFVGTLTLEIYVCHLLLFYLIKDIGMIENTHIIVIAIIIALIISYPVHILINKAINSLNNI